MGGDPGARPGGDQRRAFRAFVKANHPDAGGDPDAFVAGMRHWQKDPDPPARASGDVVFHRRRKGAARLTGWWSARKRRPRRAR